ncbi:ependymin-related protein 1-like [Haliotis asinina]|uniref:ependymin-related protein 1-like n=1 Tax=Haliotis asinina TaxID=109174 RepID=UPI0035327400
MILQVSLVLAALSAVGSSYLCCAPSRFSANQDVTFTNSTTTYRGLYYFVWDSPNKRYVVGEDRIETNFYGIRRTIYDYKKRTAYKIDAEARTCSTFPTQGRFDDQENVCVPSTAQTLGPLFYGFDVDTLHGRTYITNSTTPDGRQKNVIAVVTKDCIPIISTTIVGGYGQGDSLRVLAYNNVFPGVKDISIFEVPSYCYA